jgi:hypothetical protein
MAYIQIFARAVEDENDRVSVGLLEPIEARYKALGRVERVGLLVTYTRFRSANKVPTVDYDRDDFTSSLLEATEFP